MGCAAWVCVLRLWFRLRPATPAWGVGVCVSLCLRAPLVPRHSWLGCAVWVCGLGLRFQLRHAGPGWGVGVCVSLCARSACTPPLLAGACGVGVCAWARVSAAPHHSWLGCWAGCLFVCVLRLYPTTPGWVVRCGCVCLGSGFGCAPPLLAGALGCLCVLVCALRLYPATPGWGVQCWCVGLASGLGCAPPLLARVLGFVFVYVRAPRVPRHSWLGCAVWVCVLGLGFRLLPATPGWVVGVCQFVCALRLYPATPGWGLWFVGWVMPGTCLCAVVSCVLCALPGIAGPGGRCCSARVRVPLLWPTVCLSGVPRGPALVRRASSGPVALSALVGFPNAVVPFPIPGACAPRFYWAAVRAWRPDEKGALCACRWPPPRQGLWGRSAPYPFGAPRKGCPWRVPPASVLGCLRCGGLRCPFC